MRLLVVGAGATGGAGCNVSAARENRARQVRESGLVLQTPTETVVVRPRLFTAGDLQEFGREKPLFELIVVSTKSYGLESAMEDITPVAMSCESEKL